MFQNVQDKQERARLIKKEYGTGGAGWSIEDFGLHGYDSFKSSGLTIRWRDEEGEKEGDLNGKITAMNFVQKQKAEYKKKKLKSNSVTKLATAENFVLSEDKEEKLSEIIAEINSIAGKSYDNDVAVKAMLQIRIL